MKVSSAVSNEQTKSFVYIDHMWFLREFLRVDIMNDTVNSRRIHLETNVHYSCTKTLEIHMEGVFSGR